MVLSALRLGLIVMNKDYVVTGWNRTCEDMWGIREEEALGKELFSLDVGLNFHSLRSALAQVLRDGTGTEPIAMDAINRRGKPIQCNVRINPLADRPEACW
jgi:two-component system CheB/CheR fusion protein